MRHLSIVSTSLMLAATFSSPSSAQTRTQAPDTIWACYIPHSGAIYRIRVTDPSQTCRTKEQLMFDWNVQGPQGPQGLQGIQGPPGPAAALTTSGGTPLLLITGTYRISTSNTLNPGSTIVGKAMCNAGDVVIGGGTPQPSVLGKGTLSEFATVSSGPVTAEFIGQKAPPAWGVTLRSTINASVTVTVTAICLAIGH